VADWREALPADGDDWILGFDAAFASDPAAVAVVGHSPLDPRHLICGHVQRWLPERSRRRVRRSRAEDTAAIERVVADVAEVASRYRARVVVDQHLPGVVVDELAKHGVSALVRAWSAESRTRAAQAVRARMLTRRIELPDDPQLVAELSRLRSRFRGRRNGRLPPVDRRRVRSTRPAPARHGPVNHPLGFADTIRYFHRPWVTKGHFGS
jgi:hypothetical protein